MSTAALNQFFQEVDGTVILPLLEWPAKRGCSYIITFYGLEITVF